MPGNKKLTDLNVSGIKYCYNVEKVSLRDIAKVYGISHVQVYRIVNGIQRTGKKKG